MIPKVKPEDDIEAAHALIANGTPEAVGYRLLIKPLDASKHLEAKEAERAPTLAAAGFEVKTANQEERETRGSNQGIVVSIGDTAYDRLGKQWVEVGDVVIFHRYAGTRVELPPGSGEFYQFMNDEDIFGRMK